MQSLSLVRDVCIYNVLLGKNMTTLVSVHIGIVAGHEHAALRTFYWTPTS
jgi:hypothetical protein